MSDLPAVSATADADAQPYANVGVRRARFLRGPALRGVFHFRADGLRVGQFIYDPRDVRSSVDAGDGGPGGRSSSACVLRLPDASQSFQRRHSERSLSSRACRLLAHRISPSIRVTCCWQCYQEMNVYKPLIIFNVTHSVTSNHSVRRCSPALSAGWRPALDADCARVGSRTG
jgi:hypothetical protein